MANQNVEISTILDRQTKEDVTLTSEDISIKKENEKSSPNKKDVQVPKGRLAVGENDRCAHFVQRKKRTCRMMVKPGKKFCGEHAIQEEEGPVKTDEELTEGRIKCPYDPNHTCDAKKLSKHLKKCPCKPEPLPEFVRIGANGPSESEPASSVSIRDTSDEKLLEIIGLVNSIYDTEIRVETQIKSHPIVEEEMSRNASFFGPEVLKHLIQNSSLLGNLESKELLKGDESFVEFGSGRGQLTYWIVKSTKSSRYFLVDRESHRHKFDNKLRDELPEADVQRIRADILNLVLGEVPGIKNQSNSVVAVSKHLCGIATDFALKCLQNFAKTDSNSTRIEGILIALCCHHRCLWSSYVGKDFLLKRGLTGEDFSILQGLTSWAVCGTGKPRDKKDKSDEVPPEHDNEDAGQTEPKVLARYDRLDLDRSKREEIGRRCKRIIDQGRCDFVEKEIGLKNCKMIYYVDPSISLENVALFAVNSKTE